MSTPLPDFPDVERVVIDYLLSQSWPDPATTVGIVVDPRWRWQDGDPPHIGVAADQVDETYAWQRPGALNQQCLVRITAWASTRGAAKDLAQRAQAALMMLPARPVAGVVGGLDEGAASEASRAPLATCTVAITQEPVTG